MRYQVRRGLRKRLMHPDSILLAVAVVAIAWFTASVAVPFFQTAGFEELQDVWYRWQAWNAGVVAFIAAALALVSARFRAEQERLRAEEEAERSFEASRALLPEHLSALLQFLKLCQNYLIAIHPRGREQQASRRLEGVGIAAPPPAPEGHQELVAEAIKWGPIPVVGYVKGLLGNLQVYKSRLRELVTEQEAPNAMPSSHYVEEVLLQGATLHLEIDYLLGFVRDDEELLSEVTVDDLKSGLRAGGVYFPENFGFSQERLERRAATLSREFKARLRSSLSQDNH